MLDREQVIEMLKIAVSKERTQAAWADKHDLSRSYVNDVLLGKREPGPAILEPLGLRRKVVYEVKP